LRHFELDKNSGEQVVRMTFVARAFWYFEISRDLAVKKLSLQFPPLL
jgi:hypothetical protein